MKASDFAYIKLPFNKTIITTKTENNLFIKLIIPLSDKRDILILNNNESYLEKIKKGEHRYQALLNFNDIESAWIIDKDDISKLFKEIDSNVPIVYKTMEPLPSEVFKSIIPTDNVLSLTYLLCVYIISILKQSGRCEVGIDSIIETLHLNDYFIKFERFIIASGYDIDF